MFTLAELRSILPIVRAAVPETPQFVWPLLSARVGAHVVVKHENHTPIGAFKVRGGLVYFDRLKRQRPNVNGLPRLVNWLFGGEKDRDLVFQAHGLRELG